MYLMVLTNGWRQYHVMSPNYLLLENAATVPEFSVHGIDAEGGAWKLREHLSQAKAIICDTVCWRYFQDITDIPKILISVDAHALYMDKYEESMKMFQWADYVLSPYIFANNESDRIYHLPKSLKAKTIFYPHCVDGNPVPVVEKTIEAMLSGAVSATYPFREEAAKIEWLQRPETHTAITKRDYLEYIAKAKVVATCNSRIGYTVAKYFEIPFAGSLLYAPAIKSTMEAELLGFDDSVMEIAKEKSMVEIEGRVKQILASYEGRTEKLSAAKNLIMTRHTIHNRLRYLKSLLDRITSKRFMIYDQFDLFIDSWKG